MNYWDLLLILVASLQGTALAYIHNAELKAIVCG
jgi:hypothetical protein